MSSKPDPILLVDDEDDTLDATIALLTSQGYEVVGANSGPTALALLRDAAVRPFVILLDLNMPGMDGWQFRAELLCDRALAAIPVVVLSAAGGPAVAAAAGAMRAVAGLVKPVDPDHLLHVLRALPHCIHSATPP